MPLFPSGISPGNASSTK
ncbi:hypothetical protein Nmel_001328, partial [Mimus melanotis]